MSATAHSISLLGHDSELPRRHWIADVATRNFQCRRLIWATTASLVTLTFLIVLYPQWYSYFRAPVPKLLKSPDSAQRPGLERDLKWLLHLEDHLSREPAVRHFQWNITKASIAPNGVAKDVFLINGIVNFFLSMRFGSAHELRPISWSNNRGPLW